jgi:hypothetical protein
MRTKEPKRFESEKPYVIVAPIYVSRLPLEVEAYLKSCTFSGNKNIWFVVTCGGGMGGAAHQKRRNAPPFKKSDQHVMGKRHGRSLSPDAHERQSVHRESAVHQLQAL